MDSGRLARVFACAPSHTPALRRIYRFRELACTKGRGTTRCARVAGGGGAADVPVSDLTVLCPLQPCPVRSPKVMDGLRWSGVALSAAPALPTLHKPLTEPQRGAIHVRITRVRPRGGGGTSDAGWSDLSVLRPLFTMPCKVSESPNHRMPCKV